MKFLFLFLVVGVSVVVSEFQDNTTKENDYTMKQKDMLRLLNHVYMPNFYKDQFDLGESFDFTKNYDYFKNMEAVKDFYEMYQHGMLPKYKIFSIFNDVHRDQVIGLFHAFFYAKDFQTFYQVACWARNNMNEGMFVYAFTVALIHREDCRGFYIPPPYEIYPNFFINNEIMQRANYLKSFQVASNTPMADRKFFVNNKDTYDYPDCDEEYKITYFTHDIGLNTYYYYFHAAYPFWMTGNDFNGVFKNTRGEIYYYFHQQLMARYYMERIANDMGEIPTFSWTDPIKTGYKSFLSYFNGMHFPSRPDYFNMNKYKYNTMIKDMDYAEAVIKDAVRYGFVYTDDGTKYNLRDPKDINTFGNIIQGNVDSPNYRLYKYIGLFARFLLGNTPHFTDNYNIQPSELEHYETTLRDPIFYQYCKMFMKFAFEFKTYLKPYQRKELFYDGIIVRDMNVNDMYTYFDDKFNVDITNGVYNYDFNEKKEYTTYQRRLNHNDFTMNFFVDSNMQTAVEFRVFFGPMLKSYQDINKYRNYFYEVDRFYQDLKFGTNEISRKSSEFFFTKGDFKTTKNYEQYFYFPSNLLLPKGRTDGFKFQFFVMAVPCTNYQTKTMYKYDYYYSRCSESYALGYPFDRYVDVNEFPFNYDRSNMHFKEVTVFHKNDMVSNKMDVFFYKKIDTVDKYYNTKTEQMDNTRF